ncbi:MAG: hypothetical protein JWP27_1784 [Flaviaesturariibacter sp.]|nr:hypothetical protein [Flaviaesturariibacter sp.]
MKDQFYNTPEENAQTSTIWEEGTYLTERLQGFHRIMLYQVDDFYVEVTYHTHFNVILRVSRFSDTHYLEPYLQSININALLG